MCIMILCCIHICAFHWVMINIIRNTGLEHRALGGLELALQYCSVLLVSQLKDQSVRSVSLWVISLYAHLCPVLCSPLLLPLVTPSALVNKSTSLPLCFVFGNAEDYACDQKVAMNLNTPHTLGTVKSNPMLIFTFSFSLPSLPSVKHKYSQGTTVITDVE